MKSLLIIFIGAIVVLFTGLGKKESRSLPLVMLVLLAALALVPFDILGKLPWKFEMKYVPNFMIVFDFSARAFSAVLILATIFILGLFSQKETVGADLLGLIMFSLCGAIMMTAFTNLVILFLGLEALSIPLYILAGSKKSNLKGNEAAIKYFLMGAFSTVIFLLGCALLYGATGVLDLGGLNGKFYWFTHMGEVPSLATVGILLIMVGFCFKIAAVPFHFWSPDVYEGSPNRATVFMAVVVKIAAFAAFYRLFSVGFDDVRLSWGPVLAAIAAITILVGNIAALMQKNVKRTLAYSSIAHAGYMILAVLAARQPGFWALLFYGLAYAMASTTVFYLFNKVSADGDEGFSAFNGLAKTNKLAAISLAIAMFSMAGIPLTAGFIGKYSLFTAVFVEYKWLVIVALIGSAISIGYYFRIFKNAFFYDHSEGVKIESTLLEKLLMALAVILILLLGMAPGIILNIQFLK